MRWPWQRTDQVEPDPHAMAAAENAERKLREVQERQPHVDRVRRRLMELADRNHFAESIEASFARRRT